jgi:MFS family permease
MPGRLNPILLLQAANLCSGLGNAMVTLAIPWLILERTGSAAFAGLVLAVSSLPPLLLAPFGGWLVDHIGRRAVSIGSDILSALSVTAFPIVAWLFGLSGPVILLLALLGALFDPAGYTARKALLTDAARVAGVDQQQLNGVHDGVFSIGWVAGPALGAWLIASFGVLNTFWAAAALFLISALCIGFLRIGDLGQAAREDRGDAVLSGRASVVRGFVVLWEDRVLRTLTIAYLIIAAIYLPTESIVLAAHFEALREPASLGFVISMLAAGATIGAFGFGWLSARLSRPMILRVTLVGTAVSILPMALLPPVSWLATAGFFLGLFWGPLNPLITTLIQQRVPADEQGRVISVQLSAFYAAPPLGMLLTGLAVERWGVGDTYLALGVALAVTALVAYLSKALRSDF